MMKKIVELEKTEERLTAFTLDVLDYHSVLEALKGCCAMFCCPDIAAGYDVSSFHFWNAKSFILFKFCMMTFPAKYHC